MFRAPLFSFNREDVNQVSYWSMMYHATELTNVEMTELAELRHIEKTYNYYNSKIGFEKYVLSRRDRERLEYLEDKLGTNHSAQINSINACKY